MRTRARVKRENAPKDRLGLKRSCTQPMFGYSSLVFQKSSDVFEKLSDVFCKK